MYYKIIATDVRGRRTVAGVDLPASKSISNRVLILQALSGGGAIENLADCDDTSVMVKALQAVGGVPTADKNIQADCLDIGAAGTAMRFLTAFLAQQTGRWTLTGTERMRKRPIRMLVEALRGLGAHIEYAGEDGFPPLRIEGRRVLRGGEVSLSGGVSSQYISALLMVAPLMEQGLRLHLEGKVISEPYIRLTLGLMAEFGVTATWENGCITVPQGAYRPVQFRVESDWSAASYWYEVVALVTGAEVELRGLFADSMQGDAAGARLFERLGVKTSFTPEGVLIRSGGDICRRLEYDFVNEPDLAQTFAVTCAALGVPFRFSGLQSLRIKETDRLAALVTELEKLGYRLRAEGDDVLAWDGERCPHQPQAIIATYEDHRMAMAFAPLALVCAEGVGINEPQVVSKSYPSYWRDLRAAGFNITEG